MANSRAAWNRHTSQPAVSANPTAAMVTSHGASTPRLRRAASTNAAAKTEVTPASTIRPARRSTYAAPTTRRIPINAGTNATASANMTICVVE